MAEADAATRTIIRLIDQIAEAGIGRHLSLKLTQIGLTVDRATCVDNLRRVLDPATAKDFFVRVEMEDSRYTQVTLDVFEILWQQGYRNVGPVIQAYLPRSVDDVGRRNRLGARVRLVKGHTRSRDGSRIDRRLRSMRRHRAHRPPAPDRRNGSGVCHLRRRRHRRDTSVGGDHDISRDRYELQMPYGIRRDLQSALTADGYRVRVDVPFGTGWFPYVMRRIGERPSRLRFVVNSLLRDR